MFSLLETQLTVASWQESSFANTSSLFGLPRRSDLPSQLVNQLASIRAVYKDETNSSV